MRVLSSNREAIARLSRRCTCSHTNLEHGLWTDSACRFECTCPGFYVGARVRLGTRWEA